MAAERGTVPFFSGTLEKLGQSPAILLAALNRWAGWAFLAVICTAAMADEPRRLTHDGQFKFDLTFARGGEELIYTLQESPTLTVLMRLNLVDGTTSRVHPNADKNEFEPAVTPDGKYLAFVRSRGNLSLELVIRDQLTQDDAIVDPGKGFASLRHPAISPDGTTVIYAMAQEAAQPLFRVTNKATLQTKITEGNSLNMWPSYSPDGRRIVFGSDRDDNFELYVMNADGGNVRRLTHRPQRDMRPRWSPDGQWLAFTSTADGNDEIYLLHIETGELRRLTHHIERDDYAAWHSDARHIAIVSEREGEFDVWLYDVATATKVPAENR